MSSDSVPENIRAMKSKGTMVKVIHGKYYVYEYFHVKENDKWKTKMRLLRSLGENTFLFLE